VPRAAPRIPPELIDAIGCFDDGSLPIAELWRLSGVAAVRLGVPQPSYQQVRLWVHEIRGGGWNGPTWGSAAKVAVEVALRLKPPEALVEHVAGDEWAQPGRVRRS